MFEQLKYNFVIFQWNTNGGILLQIHGNQVKDQT